jgi:SAM-dependent methyltransferase
MLLDIGSASGRFILQNKSSYKKAIGLEITPEAVKFSREILNLEILEDINDLSMQITMVTAWHSLEHIPHIHLQNILDVISRNLVPGGRFLISIPNNNSWQYRFLGSSYTYFDTPNHLHQFSDRSIDLLMSNHGFENIEIVKSFKYNSFGYLQGIINKLTGTHNYLYYRVKRKSQKQIIYLDIINIVLVPILLPLSWLLGWFDGLIKRKQGVITICYQRKIV